MAPDYYPIAANRYTLFGGVDSSFFKIVGEATTRAIVGKGGKVIIFALNEERGEAMMKELADSVFWPGPTDVTVEDAVNSSIEKGVEKFGKISGVVNCAGIAMAQKVWIKLLGIVYDTRSGHDDDKHSVGILKRNTPLLPLSFVIDCLQEWSTTAAQYV